jgi:hypothetical protein
MRAARRKNHEKLLLPEMQICFSSGRKAPLEKAADQGLAVSWRFAPSKQRKKPTLPSTQFECSVVRLIHRLLYYPRLYVPNAEEKQIPEKNFFGTEKKIPKLNSCSASMQK